MKHWSLSQYRVQRRKRVDHVIGASLLFLFAISVGLTWRAIEQIGDSIQQKRAAMVERRDHEMSRSAIVDRVCDAGHRITERAASIIKQASVVPASRLLADVADTLPAGTVLTSISIGQQGRGSLTLYGRSTQEGDLRDFINRLDESVDLNVRSVNVANANDFKIECTPARWNAATDEPTPLEKTAAIELAPLP